MLLWVVCIRLGMSKMDPVPVPNRVPFRYRLLTFLVPVRYRFLPSNTGTVPGIFGTGTGTHF
ncbi:hypothetical protein Hanom_Chr02g00130551 [Helianthus anomalus]